MNVVIFEIVGSERRIKSCEEFDDENEWCNFLTLF